MLQKPDTTEILINREGIFEIGWNRYIVDEFGGVP
jgi:hypothetical protein